MQRKVLNDVENSYLSYIADISAYPLLNFEEEQKLADRMLKGDQRARDKLINSNLRLVVKIAMQYYRPRYNLMDLIQEGNIGLITAVDKFNHKKRLRFSTYSSWWIKHFITRSILKKEFHINMPLRKVELLYKMEHSIYSLFKKQNKVPSIGELEQELGVKAGKIKDIIDFTLPVISLDSPVGPESDMSLMELISSKEYQPDEMVFNRQLLEYELKILESLVRRDAEIIKYRYGFYEGKSLTLKEVAKIFNISPEAIRQIELKVLKKMRTGHKDLRDYFIN